MNIITEENNSEKEKSDSLTGVPQISSLMAAPANPPIIRAATNFRA